MGIDINSLPPWAQKQIADKVARQMREKAENRASNGGEGKSKYNNTPAERSGESANIRFASQKEARRYDELMLMLKAGKIRDLKLQQDFTLQEAYTTPQGERIRAIRYKADFVYEKRIIRQYQKDGGYSFEEAEEWEKVVEDTKGGKATQTPIYKMKKKMMQEKYGITIREV